MNGPQMTDEALNRMKALREDAFKHLAHLGDYVDRSGWGDPWNTRAAFTSVIRTLDVRIKDLEEVR